MGAPRSPSTSKMEAPITRARSSSGAKRQHELIQSVGSTGLTPMLGGLAMAVESPRKTPKLGAADDCKSAAGQKPEAFELPESRQTESDDDDDDGLATMVAFHQKKTGTSPDERTILGTLPDLTIPVEEEADDDGWATITKPKRNKAEKKEYEMPDDAYCDPDWSEDDGCDYETYSNAKRGGNSKGKHCNTFNVSRTRNMAIAKRDKQRQNS